MPSVDGWAVLFPLWPLMLLCLLLPIAWLRQRERKPAHVCPACGYDLRSNEGATCPKCGSERAAKG